MFESQTFEMVSVWNGSCWWQIQDANDKIIENVTHTIILSPSSGFDRTARPWTRTVPFMIVLGRSWNEQDLDHTCIWNDIWHEIFVQVQERPKQDRSGYEVVLRRPNHHKVTVALILLCQRKSWLKFKMTSDFGENSFI